MNLKDQQKDLGKIYGPEVLKHPRLLYVMIYNAQDYSRREYLRTLHDHLQWHLQNHGTILFEDPHPSMKNVQQVVLQK